MGQIRFWNLLKGTKKRLSLRSGGNDDDLAIGYAELERQIGADAGSIRNVMTELTDDRWVQKPHVGAGQDRLRVRLTRKGERWMEKHGLLSGKTVPGCTSWPI